jgi:predicted phage terminase large subunit-like protein
MKSAFERHNSKERMVLFFFMNTINIINKLREKVLNNSQDYQVVDDLFEMIRIYENENPKEAHLINREVRSVTAAQVKSIRHNVSLSEKFYLLHKRSLLFDAPIDFDAYLQYVEFDRDPSKKFYLPRRKIIRPIINSLQQIEDNKLDLLAISQPPGTGKSTIGIFFLSWEMGKYPDKPNLASAHSDKLTRSFYDGVLSIITDSEYLWHDVFPGLLLVGTNSKDETIDLAKAKRFKTLTCRSIDGSLTGATRCENILYADDLVSGIEEALSKERLDNLWGKYTNDLKSRKKLGCKEIHIATRWSIHDPIGRLERQYSDDSRAKFLALPALNENNESNFDYDYGVGFDTKYFLDMKESLDDVSWRCLFQNEPIEREGILYNEDDLRRYYDLPVDKPDTIIGVCDTAEGGGDDTFLPVAYVYGEDYYIEDCVCDNGLPEVTDALCAEILLKHNVKQCQFESNSAGGRTADKVQEKIKEKGGITRITKKRTTANKETKIIVNSTFVKEHFLFKDKSRYASNSSYAKMVKNLCSYTVMGKNKHDDVPDGLAQFAEYIQSLKGGKVEIFKRPF